MAVPVIMGAGLSRFEVWLGRNFPRNRRAAGLVARKRRGKLQKSIASAFSLSAVSIALLIGMTSGAAVGVSASSAGASPLGLGPELSAAVSATTYDIALSIAATRSSPVPLDQKSIAGNAFIFTKPDTGILRVLFFLDDPYMTKPPRHVETVAPYDLVGSAPGGSTSAAPFDTRTLSNGQHTLTAKIELSAGGSTVKTAIFFVANTRLFSWQIRAPSPIARFEAQGTSVGGKLYVFGGFVSVCCTAVTRSDVYDPLANTWRRLADLPLKVTHSPAVPDGNEIYLVGGYVGDHPGPSTRSVLRYEIAGNTWSYAAPLPQDRGAGAAARAGRTLHFFGGATRIKGATTDLDQDEHYALNLDAPVAWLAQPAMPNARNHLGGTELGGALYAVGGQHARNETTGNVGETDAFDVQTKVWSRVADLPTARGHITSSTFGANGRVLAAGGVANSGAASAEVTEFDPISRVWLKLPSLPVARKSPVAASIGDALVVTTGYHGGPTSTTWSGVIARRWNKGSTMPVGLGEVAGGIIGNTLYLVGQGSNATLAYNLSSGAWRAPSALEARPYAGNHHAAEVLEGKLYLLGGLGAGMGKLQIYDPASNSWSVGPDMPFAAGSSSSAVIGGKIYVAGGIVGSSTTGQVARYDPVLRLWTLLSPMKQPRNHAAAATDGTRLYVFGGRGPGSGDSNAVANGFDTVQVYDPRLDLWTSSLDPGSLLASLPQARGGMGRAAWVYGKFHILGGETSTGAGATTKGVYNRVDIYDPLANAWQLGTPMPTARHGIFPLVIGGRIYVAGGGTQAGSSTSSVLEVYFPG
jgi:N-acetylneuraminic acid mutarotase